MNLWRDLFCLQQNDGLCFSCVYKCVCKQFSERLYADLIDHITRHVQSLSEQLQNHVRTIIFIVLLVRHSLAY